MVRVGSLSRWSIEVARTVLILAIVLAVGAVYQARGDNHDTVWYACLYAGSLSQVSTNQPVNCGRGTQVSWGGASEDSSITGFETVTETVTEFTVNIMDGYPDSILLYCPVGLVPVGSGYTLLGMESGGFYMGGHGFSATTDRAVARDALNPFDFPSELFSPNSTFNTDYEYGWEFIVESTSSNPESGTFYVHCANVEAPADI